MPSKLDLRILSEPPGQPAVTPARGQFYAEAAAVCLEDNSHQQGVALFVRGLDEYDYELYWPAATPQMQRAYDDLQDSTSYGACGVALAVTIAVTGLKALQQARKSGGFDYWIGEKLEDLFQNASRLEISGILKGDDRTINARIRQKKKQTMQSDELRLPAFICVVEFSRPIAHLVKR